MAPPSSTHGVIQSRLDRLIGNFLDSKSESCVVATNPGVALSPGSNADFRVPDLGVTCAPIRAADAVLPDPVLLIEILSPGNQSETWTNVWAYTKIPSVTEIVVFRSTSVGALVLRRGADRLWPDQAVPCDTGELVLESIGFSFAIEDAYRGTWLAADA
jgi:Uma2 family endonuclease